MIFSLNMLYSYVLCTLTFSKNVKTKNKAEITSIFHAFKKWKKKSTKRNSPHTRYPKRHIIHTHIYSKHELKLTGKKKKRLSNDRNIFTTILRCKWNIYEKHTELFILHAYTNENYIQYIWKYTIYNPQQMGICHSSLALYGIFK